MAKVGRLLGPAVVLAALALGMYLLPLRALGARLTSMPGDLVDGRFNVYVLEHGWRVLRGQEARFWDAPFFYPEPNVIAWSDSHLGTLPFYVAFRAVGVDRETSAQLWLLVLCVLNYVACAWVLRRVSASWVGAAAGAYVFAFGLPVAQQLGHVQVYPRFLVPPALYFAFRVCSGAGPRAWAALAACVVWQLYCTLYNGYFLLLLLAAFVPACVVLRWRRELWQVVQARGWWPPVAQASLFVLAVSLVSVKPRPAVAAALLGLGEFCWYWRDLLWHGVWGGSRRQFLLRGAVLAASTLAVVPLLVPYVQAARDHRRVLSEVLLFQPRPLSWLSAPANALAWSALSRNAAGLPAAPEHMLFLGGLPSFALLAALGWVVARRLRGRCAFTAAAVLGFVVVFVLTLRTDLYCLYTAIYPLPGVNAFRAVCRIGLVLAFPAAAALAWLVTAAQDWLARRTGLRPAAMVSCLLLPLLAADQAMLPAGFCTTPKQLWQQRCDRVVALVRQNAPRARLLLDLSPAPGDARESCAGQRVLQHLDAMLASQVLGIPTLNGYSGNLPEGAPDFWTVQDLDQWAKNVRSRVGDERLQRRVPGYAAHGFEGLCVLGRLHRASEQPRTASWCPLLPGGLRCRLELGPTPAEVEPGGSFSLLVRATNLSPWTWPALGAFRVGVAYRWLLPDGGQEPCLAPGRVWLCNDVGPSETGLVEADILTSLVPGEYVLELNMMQDNAGVTTDASQAVRCRITCGPRVSGPSPPPAAVH
jgi:hypothetical protein